MAGSSYARSPRPGGGSLFLLGQTASLAAGFWVWLCVLVFRGATLSGWHVLAAAGAVSATLLAGLLGLRIVLDRAAAERHDMIMRAIVDLSWEAFGNGIARTTDRTEQGGATVIRLPQEGGRPPR